MKIEASNIRLYAERTSVERHEQRESLAVWKTAARPAQNRDDAASQPNKTLVAETDHATLTGKAQDACPQRSLAGPVAEEELAIADLNIRVLAAMVERLTGRLIKVKLPQDAVPDESVEEPAGEAPTEAEAAPDAGFGLAYDYYESHYEYEATSFAAAGVIRTEDGQEIDISVTLNMSREFMSTRSLSIRAGEALKDPLVVNFSGTAAQLSQRDFAFDIDADGKQDQIAFVGPNSGFLALDKDGDDTIDDGSELFGPLSGNGFAELAEHDQDKNSWIDENDAVYEHLRIWTKDANGENRLFALGEKGIGAIYLDHIATPFAIKDGDNELLGQVRTSGLFLRENSAPGTVQQIDLTV